MMEYNVNHITALVRIEITKYGKTIKAYQERVSTWKDPNTCEKYFRIMNKSEDFIDLAIAFLTNNNAPLDKKLMTRYEKYQELRVQVIP